MIEPILIELVSKYPIVSAVLMIMGVCRLILKPTMVWLKAVAAATPTPKDDLLVEQVEGSKIYKGLVWLLDYVFSLKLPGSK